MHGLAIGPLEVLLLAGVSMGKARDWLTTKEMAETSSSRTSDRVQNSSRLLHDVNVRTIEVSAGFMGLDDLSSLMPLAC